MGKRKASSGGDQRAVYREFGPADPMARAVPDLPPSQQTLKVEVSRKGRGGKTVTVISGFQHSPQSLSTLAKQLKAQCGSGGTAKDDRIEIQGDHAQTLMDLLVTKGYRAKRSGG